MNVIANGVIVVATILVSLIAVGFLVVGACWVYDWALRRSWRTGRSWWRP